ncbi:sugar phosphate isomerase/epimerase family protein [Dyadobacter tibetensis]|uniref:sugar phosphate isomerase/epimerase family protein n=1 Tax=Dyadobacter tibetensis TaxID=1211851 RepID=UPI00047093E1|nr:sugar phosphate isomerase/epimerase [Dyadobacter tibetensis]
MTYIHKLSSLLTAILLTLISYVHCWSQNEAVYNKPLGVQAYTFRASWPKGIQATLDTIQQLGITEMEGGPIKGISTTALRAELDKRGIAMPSIGTGYVELMKDPENTIRNAKILGAKYVMVAWIPHPETGFDLSTAQKAVEDFNRIGKILYDNGLTFCYHNHGYEFVPHENGTLFDYIVDKTDPKYVSFEMDLLWTKFPGQDPAALLLKYGSRWKLMHLKDLKKGVKGDLSGGTPTTNDVALGTGQIDIKAALIAAKKIGIEHYFIEDESPYYIKQIPVTIDYIRSLQH